jgi:hypothetical protein
MNIAKHTLMSSRRTPLLLQKSLTYSLLPARKTRSRFKVPGSKSVLNEVKDLSALYRSFEAQDARSAHFELGTCAFGALLENLPAFC